KLYRRTGKREQAQEHARQHPGLARVDLLDPSVGVWAAQHCGVSHVRHDDVVDVLAAPGQQAWVLDPLHALADPATVDRMIFDGRRAHRASPFIAAAALSTASTIVW